jgi:hypothetical protein
VFSAAVARAVTTNTVICRTYWPRPRLTRIAPGLDLLEDMGYAPDSQKVHSNCVLLICIISQCPVPVLARNSRTAGNETAPVSGKPKEDGALDPAPEDWHASKFV